MLLKKQHQVLEIIAEIVQRIQTKSGKWNSHHEKVQDNAHFQNVES